MNKLFIGFLFVAFAWGCTFPSRKAAHRNDKMFVNNSGNSLSIWLNILRAQKTDTTTLYFAEALYDGKKMGFEVDVPLKTLTRQGYGDGICFKSTGQESDDLLAELAKLCNAKINPTDKFVKAYAVSYTDLNQFVKATAGATLGDSTIRNFDLHFLSFPQNGGALMIEEDRNKIGMTITGERSKPIVIQLLTQN